MLQKVYVTINTIVMAENVDEIESLVGLAKELCAKISVALAHEYCNINAASATTDKTMKIAHRLIEMKQEGYPIVNSISYFRVMGKEKKWQCKPWAMVNIDPYGNAVLPCYVHNDYASSISVFENGIKNIISGFDWKKIENCKKCSLHCYVEPSLALSGDFKMYMHWAFRVSI